MIVIALARHQSIIPVGVSTKKSKPLPWVRETGLIAFTGARYAANHSRTKDRFGSFASFRACASHVRYSSDSYRIAALRQGLRVRETLKRGMSKASYRT